MVEKITFLEGVKPNTTKLTLGVGAIIFRHPEETPIAKQEMLLELRADGDIWGIPGGKIEIGESVTEAVLREVKEETNINGKMERLLGIYSHPDEGTIRQYPGDPHSQQVIDIFFLVTALTSDMKKSDESVELKFFRITELPTNIIPTVKNLMRNYRNLNGSREIVVN